MRKPIVLYPGLPVGSLNGRSFLSRFVVGAMLSALGWTGLAGADNLDETDVIRLATTYDPQALVARRAIRVAEARRVGTALLPNPSLGYTREHFPGSASANESEEALQLTLPLDFSGRRAARGHLALANVAAAGARASRVQNQAVERALLLFYTVVAEQRRLAIEQRGVEQFVEVARVVARRREAGRASGYEQVRVEIEAELASSRVRQTRERLSRQRVQLALSLGVDRTDLHVVGSLDPQLAGRGDEGATHATSALPSRTSLRLSRQVESHAKDAKSASGRSWIPRVSVSAGARLGRSEETRYGYVAGLTVELPVFSRGQGLGARAEARREQAQAIARAAEQRATAKTARASSLMKTSRGELERFTKATRERVERLERGAESGYREGRRSILELLDARRARTVVEIRRLELALVAKQAELALRAARGEFE